jgi:hypothetical protein
MSNQQQKQHEMLTIKSMRCTSGPKTHPPPSNAHSLLSQSSRPKPRASQSQAATTTSDVEKSISTLSTLLSSRESPYVFTNNNDALTQSTSSPQRANYYSSQSATGGLNVKMSSRPRRAKKTVETERSLLYSYTYPEDEEAKKNATNAALNSDSDSNNARLPSLKPTIKKSPSPSINGSLSVGFADVGGNLLAKPTNAADTVSNSNSLASMSKKSIASLNIPHFKRPRMPLVPIKANMQAQVYNFLERPTGWLCFIYHFTV